MDKVNDLFKYGGYCWICGNSDLTVLEKHHFTDDFIIHLCSNCHHRFSNSDKEKHRIGIAKKLSDYNYLDTVRRHARYLRCLDKKEYEKTINDLGNMGVLE